MKSKLLHFHAAVFVLLLLSGCGNRQVGLSGKVTYSDTGEPLTAGIVCLATPAFLARGDLDANGHYTIGSQKKADGLPPGTYKVYVSRAVRLEGDGPMPKEIPLITPKFTNPVDSGLTLTVDAKAKVFDFQVDRAK